MCMTVKQKQNLLAYLGYYIGNIDGKWGPLSDTALRAFQGDYGLPANGNFDTATEKALKHAITHGMPIVESKEPSWGDIKYFKRNEFRCKCGKCNGYPVEPSWELLEVLDDIREHFGAPVRVNSGIRCAAHNKNVGGATNSQHLYGTAADIVVTGISPVKAAAYAETLLPNTGGIGIYSWGVHVDVRKAKSRWNG